MTRKPLCSKLETKNHCGKNPIVPKMEFQARKTFFFQLENIHESERGTLSTNKTFFEVAQCQKIQGCGGLFHNY